MDEELPPIDQPDPPELDALQRDLESLEAIEADSPPEVDAMPEFPAAAGQPGSEIAPQEFEIPEIGEIGEIQIDDAGMQPLLDKIPDVSSTPEAKKPNAWQIRHGQAPAPQKQRQAQPAAEGQPRQQPAQPVAPPAIGDLHQAAKELGALDGNNEFGNWEKVFPPQGDQQDVNQGQPEVNDLRGAQNDANQALLSVLNANIECLRTLMLGLADCQRQLAEIRLGQQRRRR